MNVAAPDSRELGLLRQQDADAFARLVATYQGVVLGVGQSLGLAGADLDDAAAEAFAAIYRALPTFEGRSELGTWVYRIAFRTILKTRRRYRQGAAAILDDRPDHRQLSPDTAVCRDEANDLIWKVVALLEPRQAMVIELYYRRDWSVEQIAAAIECPVGTVKTLLSRARQRLREVLSRKGLKP